MANIHEAQAAAKAKLERKKIDRTNTLEVWQQPAPAVPDTNANAGNNSSEAASAAGKLLNKGKSPAMSISSSGIVPEQLRNNDVIDVGIADILMAKENTELRNESSVNIVAPSTQDTDLPPTPGIVNSKVDHSTGSNYSEKDSGIVPEQLRNINKIDSETIPEKLRNRSETITDQNRNDSGSNSNNSGTSPQRISNDSVARSVTDSGANPKHIRNNMSPPHVNRLSGNKLKIVQTIFDFCQERGSINTGPISREVFTLRTGIDGEVIRVTCNRLIKENYFTLLESKRGSGGFTVYELNPITHSQMVGGLHRHSGTNSERNRNNSVSQSVTGSGTTPPYSNSIGIETLNTNITIPNLNFSDRIEIPPALFATGIKLANVAAIVKTEADLERVNESLQAYAFDFLKNGVIKTAIFYGAIRSGVYYNSDAYTIEMAKERARQALSNKAREEAAKMNLDFASSAQATAETEFNKKYDSAFVEGIVGRMSPTSQETLRMMIAKNGIEFPPIKESIKNQYLSTRVPEIELQNGEGDRV